MCFLEIQHFKNALTNSHEQGFQLNIHIYHCLSLNKEKTTNNKRNISYISILFINGM